MGFVLAIYKHCQSLPTYAILSLVLSKRLHSIYVLRLFNDGVAMMGLYVSIWCLITRRWNWSALCFSLALSIKMNILLFFPAFGFIYFQSVGLLKTINLMLIIVLVQAWLAIPFLLEYPRISEQGIRVQTSFRISMDSQLANDITKTSYRPALPVCSPPPSLNLGLVCMDQMESAFGEEGLSRWFRGLQQYSRPAAKRPNELTPDYIVNLFGTPSSGLSGVANPVPYLSSVLLMVLIEYSWNVFPSTSISSTVLLVSNFLLLFGTWWSFDALYSFTPVASKKKSKVP
ncbi:hypothetical protein H4Q26_001512 [Puccinia striiformis f. sp. tritici PST-130]|nr:hypothetical protein H4Q26_001512 [Puccinia striiformis f. sp. tritici PST-130]